MLQLISSLMLILEFFGLIGLGACPEIACLA